MKLKVHITNIYADDLIELDQDIDVPAPAHIDDEEEMEDWSLDHLMPLTGTGRTDANDPAGYFVEVLECAEEPALVGFKWESYG